MPRKKGQPAKNKRRCPNGVYLAGAFCYPAKHVLERGSVGRTCRLVLDAEPGDGAVMDVGEG